jgi:hypothetical protein
MKKREIKNMAYHFFVPVVLIGLIYLNHWFLVLETFLYVWLREQAQHRWIHEEFATGLGPHVIGHTVYTIEKQTFFGWMDWHRMGEVLVATAGAIVACLVWELCST